MSNINPRTLWDIGSEYSQARDELMRMDLSDDEVLDTLSAIDGEFKDKCIAVAAAIRTMEADAAGEMARIAEFQADIESMLAKPKSQQKRAQKLREYLAAEMSKQDINEIKNPAGPNLTKFTRQDIALDDDLVPDEFVITTRKVDRMAAKRAAKSESKLPIWATFTRSQYLRIG